MSIDNFENDFVNHLAICVRFANAFLRMISLPEDTLMKGMVKVDEKSASVQIGDLKIVYLKHGAGYTLTFLDDRKVEFNIVSSKERMHIVFTPWKLSISIKSLADQSYTPKEIADVMSKLKGKNVYDYHENYPHLYDMELDFIVKSVYGKYYTSAAK